MTRRSLRPLVCLVLAACWAAPPALAQSLTAHKFSYDARALPEKPRSVNLAGSVNGWSTVATPMNDADADGVYEVELKLADGVYYYKFVVNGDQWKNDPTGDKELEIDDGYGGKNSAVLIGPDIRKLPPPKPNHINVDAVRFNPDDPNDLNVFESGRARVRVRAQAGDVTSVSVLASPAHPSHILGTGYDLERLATVQGLDVFGGVVVFDPRDRHFIVRVADEKDFVYLSPGGFEKTGAPTRVLSFSEEPTFKIPEWAKHAVWYQIFPERFRNGDPSNDPGDKDYERLIKWTADWWKTHPGEAPGQENFYKGQGNVWKRRFGGDIQGCKEALPYLRSLGVNAIYFNPVFEGDSLHKYDASDYRHIDDNFGVKGDIPIPGETDDPATWQWSESDKIFLDFLAEAHKQGFKVILDGVFNHVGQSHPFFQDVVKNGKTSTYADWFEITDWGSGGEPGKPGGIQWKAWDKPNGHLPVFKKDPQQGLAPGPYEHVMAITKRWLAPDGDPSQGIDGWRLDVPGDIPHPFWIEWRKVVKGAKPDAYITGEIWDWAQAWLQGDQFDAVMNYRFAVACQDFFVNQKKAISPSEFNARLNEMTFAYPLQVALVQQNLFDSHDTDRLSSMFVNPDLAYDASNRIQDNGPNYKSDRPSDQQWARMKQAVAFQMMFLGAPMIYYGDEAGMWSPDDPSNRMPMWWKDKEPFENPENKFNEEIFKHYQRCIAIRNKFPALQTGFFRPVVIDDNRDVYAFVRELGNERVYVVMNRSEKPATVEVPVASGDRFVNWMDPAQVTVLVPAQDWGTARVIHPPDAPQVHASDGTIKIELKPHGTAVLAESK